MKSFVQLNNAGLQPITASARDKIHYWAERFYTDGFACDADYMADVARTRQQVANLIGCTSAEIAFFTSTAAAISQVAFKIGLTDQDEVLMWDQEFSSHLYPWKSACDHSGAKLNLISSVDFYKTPTEKMIQAITPKTKVICFSWVQFISGERMTGVYELIRIAKSKNIYVFVDTIQGLGFYDFDLWKTGIDGVMSGAHKWLRAPVGAGFLALRQHLIHQIKPHTIGSGTYGTCDDPSSLECAPKLDASKYEPGSKQVLEITALGASVEEITHYGLSKIRTQTFELTQALKTQLGEIPHLHIYNSDVLDSAFVNLISNQFDLKQLSQHLKNYHILHAVRGNSIRLTPQYYNTMEDINYTLNVLRNLK